jgi:hypothetical protein
MSSIVPVNLVVKALRDSGYKNTAYAVAELIDNSIQYGASNVDFICFEEDFQTPKRLISRISEIAILDNGSGMTVDKLETALQFGNGSNLKNTTENVIGRFGMGLPSSSISQAKKVEVYSWTDTVDNSIYSYLNVDEIVSGALSEVPFPVKKQVPDEFKKIGLKFEKTGTLVVWSEIDRCLWKTGETIIKHSESLIGRMYRKFISSGQVNISGKVFKKSKLSEVLLDKKFLPNDPMYLMKNTTVTKALNKAGLSDPMFDYYGGLEGYEKEYKIHYKGNDHKVYVRYSVAKEEARKSKNGNAAGAMDHGKHAGDNIGVSVVRSGRELDLDNSWAIGYDPRERWWGVEVEFPSTLDEVFGVTNNKQYAVNFKELGSMDIASVVRESGLSIGAYKEELLDNNDLKGLLIEIAIDIENQLSIIRTYVKTQAKKLEKTEKVTRHGHEDTTTDFGGEIKATEMTDKRKESGNAGTSDKDELEKTDEEKLKDLETSLKEDEVVGATEIAEMLIKNKIKYQFIDTSFDGNAFFSVSPVGGKIIIKLNNTHPAYHKFVEVLKDDIDSSIEKDELLERLKTAQYGLKLILMAWARYEDEQLEGPLKTAVKNARQDWGRIAAEFMQ